MKKWMRSAAVLAAGMMLATSTAMAGPKPPPPPGAGRLAAPPNANPLNLTPAQQERLKALSSKMMPEIQAAIQSAKTDSQRNAKLVAIQNKFKPQMLAILTKAQRAKVSDMQAQARQKMKAAGARPNAAPKKK